MKTFKIVITICLSLILLASLALVVFTQTFDSRHFKAQLTNQLSGQLGRKVAMGKLGLSFSLFHGLFFSVQEFSVMDDERFSSEALLKIADLKLDMDIGAFLMRKKIVISNIAVVSPHFNLVRDAGGKLNIQALAPPIPSPSKDNSQHSKVVSPSAPSAKKNIPNFPQLLVQAIRVEQGSMTFTDKTPSSPMRLELKDMTFSVAGLSSTSPFKFTFGCSLWSDEQDIKVRGQAQIDLKNLQVRFDDMKMDVDLSAINPSELEKDIPNVKSSEQGLTMQGKIETSISQMVIGQTGLLVLSGTGKITDEAFNLEQIPLYTKGTISYEISEKNINVRDIALTIDGGSLTGQAKIDDYLTQPRYSMDLDFKDISLVKSIPEFGPQANFHGTLNGRFKLAGQGFQPDKMFSGVLGDGQLDIASGKIDNFNILRFIIGKIPMIPKLEEVLIANLPEASKKQIEEKGTVFDKIEMKTTFANETVFIDKAEFTSQAFSVTANGKLDQARDIDFSAILYISKDLSDQMVVAVDDLKVLQEGDGRLSIPLKTYNGQLSGFRIFPDTEALAKKLVVNKGKDQFRKLLDKTLIPSDNAPAGASEQNQPTQPEQEAPDKMINSILNSILN